MLWETLDRVNRLRVKAMADPNFVDSAKKHQKAIAEQDAMQESKPTRYRKSSKSKPRSLAQIYDQVEFGHTTH